MVEDDPGDALMVRESFGYRARPQRSIAIFASDSLFTRELALRFEGSA